MVQEGATVNLVATVVNDTNNAGVTWALAGLGSLSDATSSQVTYNAPPTGTVTGTSTPVVTATSVTDSTKSSTVSLVVSGAPIIDPVTLFPANADTPWQAGVLVIGGESPYAWTLDSGTLPPGITLAPSTAATVNMTGTPTTTGTYTFTLKVTDNKGRTATTDVTVVVDPKAACLLRGRFALLYSGFSLLRPQTRAASLLVADDGTVSGIMDSSSATGSVPSESITGTCTTLTGNTGSLKLTGTSSGQFSLSFAVRTGLDQGRVQMVSTVAGTSGTGLLERQDSTAFALAQLPATAAFGLIGVDADDSGMGLAGRLDRDVAGNVTGTGCGRMSNASRTLDGNSTRSRSFGDATHQYAPPDEFVDGGAMT